MTLTFKYKDVPRPNNTHSTSPSIPVTLSGDGGNYEFMVLLDSGAQMYLLSQNIWQSCLI
jgi:hypothetical protein